MRGCLRSCPDTGSVIYSHAPDQLVWFGMAPLEIKKQIKGRSYLRGYICMFRRKTIQAEWAGVTYHPGMCGAVENHFPRIYQSGNTHQVSRPRQFRCHTRRASLMRQAYNGIAQLLSLEHNIPCYPSLKRTLPGKHGNVTSKEMHGVLSYNFPLLTHLHCPHNRRKVSFEFCWHTKHKYACLSGMGISLLCH